MTVIDAILLGLIQGVTEFLPISSSGHLVLANAFLGLDDNFTFSVLLNIGSLLVLIIFYRRKILDIIKRLFTKSEWRFVLKLIVATVPAVIIGVVFGDQIEYLNSLVWVVTIMLFVVGILFVFISKPSENADDREVEQSVNWKSTLKIGIAQAIALIPGTSRSGITILTGIRSKLSVERAAEFSFLMAIPIIAGATFKTLLSDGGIQFVTNNLDKFLIGNLVCFVSGYIAISSMMKLIANRGLKDFGWYRVLLAIFLGALLLAGVL